MLLLNLCRRLISLAKTDINVTSEETFTFCQAARFIMEKIHEHSRGVAELGPRYEVWHTLRKSRRLFILELNTIEKPLKIGEMIAGPPLKTLVEWRTLLCVRSKQGYHFFRDDRLPGGEIDEKDVIKNLQAGRFTLVRRSSQKLEENIREILDKGARLVEELRGEGHLTEGFFFTGIEIPLGSLLAEGLKKQLKEVEKGTYEDDKWELAKGTYYWELKYKKLNDICDSNAPWIYRKLAQFIRDKGFDCRSYFYWN